MFMFLDIPVFTWCSKSKRNAWLLFCFVSMKVVGSDKMIFSNLLLEMLIHEHFY